MQSRPFFVAVFFLAFTLHPLQSQNSSPGPSAPSAQPDAKARRPLPKPVNLKVLPKDITPEELRRTMRGYAGALGVECGFCHATNPQTHKLDFPSDAKDEKTTARTMIAMTRSINEQYMSQVHDPDATPADLHVTCGTCHRGHSMPEHFVPPPQEHHRQAPEAAQPH